MSHAVGPDSYRGAMIHFIKRTCYVQFRMKVPLRKLWSTRLYKVNSHFYYQKHHLSPMRWYTGNKNIGGILNLLQRNPGAKYNPIGESIMFTMSLSWCLHITTGHKIQRHISLRAKYFHK